MDRFDSTRRGKLTYKDTIVLNIMQSDYVQCCSLYKTYTCILDLV